MQKIKQLSLFLLLFSTLVLLSACGSKGDLYQTPVKPSKSQASSNKIEDVSNENISKAENSNLLLDKKQP